MRHTIVICDSWGRGFVASILGLLLTPIGAHADFSMSPNTAPASTPLSHRSVWARSAYPLATGYGNEIPLTFALRQIVPHGVLVVVRQGVCPSTIVSWHGGVPWDIALRLALAPTGLRAMITPVEVQISSR